MFNSKLIAQYEARISDLKLQIEDLKKLVFVNNVSANSASVAEEQNALLSGEGIIPQKFSAEEEEILAERNRLLSGMY